MIEFSEYRSKVLKTAWPKYYRQSNVGIRNLARQPLFSTWTVDNICAVNWKNDNPVDVCVDVLIDYFNEIAGK